MKLCIKPAIILMCTVDALYTNYKISTQLSMRPGKTLINLDICSGWLEYLLSHEESVGRKKPIECLAKTQDNFKRTGPDVRKLFFSYATNPNMKRVMLMGIKIQTIWNRKFSYPEKSDHIIYYKVMWWKPTPAPFNDIIINQSFFKLSVQRQLPFISTNRKIQKWLIVIPIAKFPKGHMLGCVASSCQSMSKHP